MVAGLFFSEARSAAVAPLKAWSSEPKTAAPFRTVPASAWSREAIALITVSPLSTM